MLDILTILYRLYKNAKKKNETYAMLGQPKDTVTSGVRFLNFYGTNLVFLALMILIFIGATRLSEVMSGITALGVVRESGRLETIVPYLLILSMVFLACATCLMGLGLMARWRWAHTLIPYVSIPVVVWAVINVAPALALAVVLSFGLAIPFGMIFFYSIWLYARDLGTLCGSEVRSLFGNH